MIINKLIIFDLANKEANEFIFSSKANVIFSEDNTSGKSCLLKSIYYALGLQIKNFASGWNYKDMAFKTYYTHDNITGTIIRYKDSFFINGADQPIFEREYSEWLSDLLNIKIKLPTKHDTMPQRIVASAILNLYYIDQDNSWDKAPYKNTVNLTWYDQKSMPKAVFEHVLGIKSSLNIDLAEKLSDLGKKKQIIDTQLSVLGELREEFVTKDVVSEFNMENVKEEIKHYLHCASQIKRKIGSFKSKIYFEQVKLDSFEEELRDYKEILAYNSKSYADYSKECPKCHSILTKEQSIERIKISNNIIELQIAIANLEKQVEKSKRTTSAYLNKKIDIEKEYKLLTTIAKTKQGELTLEEHLKNQSLQMARSKYYEIKTNLSEQFQELVEKIKKLESDSKKLLATQARKREAMETHFKQIITRYSMIFNTVNFDSNFLEFKQINESGAVKNQKFLALYMTYSKLLMDYSPIELPVVLDSIVKDELDTDILYKSYKLVSDVLLSSDKQTFFAILEDKMPLIPSDCYKIRVDNSSRLLSKENYEKLIGELPGEHSETNDDIAR